MADIVHLPGKQTVAALCARLRQLEMAESSDEGTMEAISDAEQGALGTLAQLSSANLADVRQKLAAVARRAEASDGFLAEPEMHLLRSALDDLRRLRTREEAVA